MNAFGLNGDEDHGSEPESRVPSLSGQLAEILLSEKAVALLRDLSSTRGKARIGRRSRALASLRDFGLVEFNHSGDPRRPWWPLTAAGRREVERRRKR